MDNLVRSFVAKMSAHVGGDVDEDDVHDVFRHLASVLTLAASPRTVHASLSGLCEACARLPHGADPTDAAGVPRTLAKLMAAHAPEGLPAGTCTHAAALLDALCGPEEADVHRVLLDVAAAVPGGALGAVR